MESMDFIPCPLIRGGHLQTVCGRLPLGRSPLISAAVPIRLSDGDQVVAMVSEPLSTPAKGTVLFIPGLGGSARSSYIKRLGLKCVQKGYRVVRLNLRGTGQGKGLAAKPYHACCSDDVAAVLRELGYANVSIVGCSLGGTIALRLGRDPEVQPYVRRIIAICPPLDLQPAVKRIDAHFFYRRYFVYSLKQEVRTNARLLNVSLPEGFNRIRTLYEFDDVYTGPQAGFEGADDYYAEGSLGQQWDRILYPTRVLFSGDDPFVEPQISSDTPTPRHVRLAMTDRGGHLGFLASPWSQTGMRWLDTVILDWMEEEG